MQLDIGATANKTALVNLAQHISCNLDGEASPLNMLNHELHINRWASLPLRGQSSPLRGPADGLALSCTAAGGLLCSGLQEGFSGDLAMRKAGVQGTGHSHASIRIGSLHFLRSCMSARLEQLCLLLCS